MKVLEVMRPIFDKVVKNYRSDFFQDYLFLKKYPGIKFFWSPRENGTYIGGLHSFDNPHERVKYLFGYSTPIDIQLDLIQCLKFHYREGREVYFFDGIKLRKIKEEDSTNIILKHVENLRRK